MPLFFVSYIYSILITVKLLSASRPFLLKILNSVPKFSMYGKCLKFMSKKISTNELYVRPSHDFALYQWLYMPYFNVWIIGMFVPVNL